MARIDLSGLEGPSIRPGEAAQAPLSAFEEDPDQPRTEFDGPEFESLLEDIKQRGILQPVVVTKTASGALRIRFGARRFRAAQRLDLSSVPYVVASDPRQLDDYAQVSENEKRSNLQPLELAAFVKKKVDAGEQKSAIASRLGVSNASITFLLSMFEMPVVLRQAYDSHACRSPRLLYELRGLHEKDPETVELAVQGSAELTKGVVEELRARVAATAGRELAGASEAAAPQQAARARDGDVLTEAAASQAGQGARHGPPQPGREEGSADATGDGRQASWSRPALQATYKRQPVVVLLDLRASQPGAAFVRRLSDGREEEAMFDQLRNLRLVDEVAR
jgi:ParB family transcriptional regulator, chromosome partitioning protein